MSELETMMNGAIYGIDFARQRELHELLSEFGKEIWGCAKAGLTSDQIAAILNLVLAVSKYHITNLLEIMRESVEEMGVEE